MDTSINSNHVTKLSTDLNYKQRINWRFVYLNIYLHFAAIYGAYLTSYARFWTNLWAVFLWYATVQCVTMGAHRLYSHKAFKATWPVRFVILFFHNMSGQFSAYRWARDHRVHHKYTDTDADPHNSNRGLFFSHWGWLMVKKHPLVYAKAKEIDDSDLKADKLLMFEDRYYLQLYFLTAIVIPVAIPVLFWGESFKNSLFICYHLRYMVASHCVASINSIAHAFGNKPYDKNISPTETMFVSWATVGEGWHNYHHAFPWDYKAAEFGSGVNVTANLLELLARFNLVSDLKTVNPSMVQARTLRTGDGTHPVYSPGKEMEDNASTES